MSYGGSSRERSAKSAWWKSTSKWSVVGLAALAVATVMLVGFVLQDSREAVKPPGDPASAARVVESMQADTEEKRPVALWIGDSYTAGTGAESEDEGESCLASARLGWICNLDAQGGTGFIANGKANSADFEPLVNRLPQTAAEMNADVIIVDAGRNDLLEPLPVIEERMRDYLTRLRDAYPDAALVQIVPFYMRQDGPTLDGQLAPVIQRLMDEFDGHVIDPIGEGWVGPGLTDDLVIKDGVHPSPEGHRYLANHLAADLRKLDLAPTSVE